MEIGFLYKLQSGFRPGDSAINQLIFFVQKRGTGDLKYCNPLVKARCFWGKQ